MVEMFIFCFIKLTVHIYLTINWSLQVNLHNLNFLFRSLLINFLVKQAKQTKKMLDERVCLNRITYRLSLLKEQQCLDVENELRMYARIAH